MSLRTVHLHGRYSNNNEPIKVVAKTVAQAIELVSRQLPQFEPHPINGRARIAVVGYDTREDLFRDLRDDETEIHIVPQFTGGKQGGILQILIGAALVGLSFVPGLNVAFASFIFKAGLIGVLGGIAAFLQPTPKSNNSKDEHANRYLGTPKNTVKIGTRIPILYGTFRVYGHFLSFDINAKDNSIQLRSTGDGK